MPEPVYRMMTLLSTLTTALPMGTNLGLLHVLWMLVSGQLLTTRGAVIPGLSACGLPVRAVRRAWTALGQGAWSSATLLRPWERLVAAEGHWQASCQGGYHPLAVDVTGFWRPRLHGCPSTHYHAAAGKALPAIPLGLVVRVGAVGAQRLAVPTMLVRAAPDDPRPRAQERLLVRAAVQQCGPHDALVLDAGFGVALLQEEGAARYVVRLAKNSTFRRANPPPYRGRGRPPTRGEVVRPLARRYKGRLRAATPPDQVVSWSDHGAVVRAEVWHDLVLPTAGAKATAVTVVAVHDPRYREPLLLATTLPVTPQDLRALYDDRWAVEHLPLAAKQMIGAARQFVHAPETCQRLPELALIAGAILSYAAATTPAIPTGFWDRAPQPTAGRLRRVLARVPFPTDFPLAVRMCVKKVRTDHLPTGFWGQRHHTGPTDDAFAA